MFKRIFVFVESNMFLHIFISHDILNKLVILLALFFLFFLLRFFLGRLSLVLHDALVLKFLQFNQLGKFFVLNSSDDNNFLVAFDILKLLCMWEES